MVVLDEPLAALDVSTRARARRLLVEHLEAFVGPRLIVTHDPTDAFMLADEVLVIENGRVVQHGEPDSIRHRPATAYVADLAGINLLTGRNDGGTVSLEGSDQVLHVADTHTDGPVVVTIDPRAIALHPVEPHGSPRNAWPATVDTVDDLGETRRVHLSTPVPLAVDVTPGAVAELGLSRGAGVWAVVKATEIRVLPR